MRGSIPAIYCVHLASSAARRRRMERRLRHHGLLAQTRFVTSQPPMPGPPPWFANPGPGSEEVATWKDRAGRACFATHLQAMRAMLTEPSSAKHGAIICEDDVLLHDEFVPRFAAVRDNLPGDPPLCSLGYFISRWSAEFEWAGKHPERENVCRMVPDALWGTYMYWLSADYAARLLDRYGGLAEDDLPAIAERITHDSGGYACYPALALEDVIDSFIRPPADLDFHVSGQASWDYAAYSNCEEGHDLSPLANTGSAGRPTIGLCMIVRDEAEVIARCLESVRPLIDTWTICDTGSVDTTPELLQKTLAGVPGTLHRRPWRDFGANRTELAELARGTADYLLLIDADMTLVRNGPLPPLSADAYLLRHLGGLEYVVPRLVRGDRRWWFEGATHEYLATEGPFTQEALDALAIEHHGDGASRGEKFERDVRLLEAAISHDPNDARAVFYLAQTLREGGEEERAIELYRRRVELGGWDEEVFYAAFQQGVLVGHRDPDAAIALLLDAHERRPQRAEPLHELARLSRLRGRYRAAYLFARGAAELPAPGDVLFVHRDIYEWGARFEQAVAGHWIGEHEEALALNEALLAEGRMSPAYVGVAEANRRRCLEALGRPIWEAPSASELSSLAPGLQRAEIRLEVEPAWPQFNPTIAANGHGFLLGVRTANYRIRDGRYEVLDADGVIRTVNYLARLDGALQVESIDPIEDLADEAPFHPTWVQGWEDLRLIEVDGRWFAIANARDVNPQARAEVALLELDGPRIVAAHVLPGPDPSRHEKNWMPFVRDGRLHFVYSCGPTVVYEYEFAAGELKLVARNDAPERARELRGGSQGIPVAGGWLFAVHEAFDGPAGRSYVQRLAMLDDELRLSHLSPRFSFDGQPVELCHGLALAGERLIFSYGVGDHTARLGVCPLAEALAILEPAA